MAGDLNARTGCADMFPCLSLNFLSYNYNRLSVDDGWFCLLLIEIFFSSFKKTKTKTKWNWSLHVSHGHSGGCGGCCGCGCCRSGGHGIR